MMVDAANGPLLGDTARGTESQTVIDEQVALMEPGRAYVQIHTHPGSAAFSRMDTQTFLDLPGLSAMTVAGGDGTMYVLSKDPEEFQATASAGRRAWEETTLEVQRERLSSLKAEELSETERAHVLKEMSHQVWLRIARGLGLRYSRVEAIDD